MLVVITNLSKLVIFKKFFGKEQSPLCYLLVNAAIETDEDLSVENFSVESKLFPSGHRLIISHKMNQKVPKRFIEIIDSLFLQEMMNPYVNDRKELSSSFSEKVEDAFNRTILKVNFSI